ncbi:MbtH family NRPS accessory protein [Achromobacter sp. MFA1 R4]|uniref:MbtH family protein n=1 Tax=Achromobacter sp. MFA1 R4 TaxID=1881016 RepID=UPI0009536E21|nr:MbtH family NRPS accessory protein [Achromobacter sp. MFA1 R4]SIT01277.1 MbtH protein [Achromobacter sp. MFA1 R4]
MSCFDRDDAVLRVLVNDEDQYSLWPDFKATPPGWRDTGTKGDKQTCLAFVERVWTDMRPASLRRFMDEQTPTTPQ